MKLMMTVCMALALAATPVLAQNQGAMPGMTMSGMGNMIGMHTMPATVNAIDARTGKVDVTAGGMALKLHFPPASLKDVRTGDRITVHLGFNKS